LTALQSAAHVSPSRWLAKYTTRRLTMQYTVKNDYGITGTSTHQTPESALRARDRREGTGWIVEDEDGNRWDHNGDKPVKLSWGGEE